LPNQSIF